MSEDDEPSKRICLDEQEMQIEADDESGICNICFQKERAASCLKIQEMNLLHTENKRAVYDSFKLHTPETEQDCITLTREFIDIRREMEHLKGELRKLSVFECSKPGVCKLSPIEKPNSPTPKENEFQIVPKRKAARKNNEIATPSSSIPTQNKFESLDKIKEIEPPVTESVPPIMLKFTPDYHRVLEKLHSSCKIKDSKLGNGFIRGFPLR
ncbi:hypothetical protein HNY73_006880 [Argiope bruennichi]|uniref:Uncharacterized protein n=1 Tax=Argiope bruennichi TaxID=94029 RepID=A0A8T0FC89_ARGBR|nr:hypothetical protein HNY73_006880 [Argiope bruennichi]